MRGSRLLAASLAGVVTLIALTLLVHRGGLITWCAFLGGCAILLKLMFKPAGNELFLALVLGVASLLLWIGSFVLIISLWESGEVVELSVDTRDGVRDLRLWVLEIEGQLTIYHDAEPVVAESLLSAAPVRLILGQKESIRIPLAQKVTDISDEQAEHVLRAMANKYGYRNLAATIYYVLLGLPRNRVPVVARLLQC